MKRVSIIFEYFQFLKAEKKYWMIPLVAVILIFGLFIALFESTALAPFIYTIF